MNSIESLKEHFKPILEIYPSEYRRKIYLDTFLKYAYKQFDEGSEVNFGLPFNYNLDRIFRTYMFSLDEQDARTIASFISYLGTNGGRYLISLFKQYAEDPFFKTKEDAFLFAWLSENRRRYGHNDNLRTIEFILTPIKDHDVHHGLSDFNLDKIKTSQYEVIEHLVRWLSTSDGIKYLIDCENTIEIEKENINEIRKVAREP